MVENTLIPPTFLFRIANPLLYTEQRWKKQGLELDPKYVLPSYHAELNGGPRFADLRVGWNQDGLAINLRVAGKKQAPWCRESRIDDSDGLSLFIDTRDTQNIHRAGRFCHRFVFCPQGSGRLMDEPTAQLVEIHRARENPKPALQGSLKIRSEKRIDGYIVQAFIESAAITGWEPDDQLRLGFSYAIVDRELGWQTFSLGPEFPFVSDPSLWGSLELVND